VVTQRILAPSRNLLPATALILLGGAGFVLGGWLAMLLVPALAGLGFGRRFTDWSWRWCDDRARRELQAVLPRFARSRLQHVHGSIERLGGLGRFATSGIAMAQPPDGAPVLILVEGGVAARVPWTLIRGWAWQAGAESASGGAMPPQSSRPGLSLELTGAQPVLWHVGGMDPALLRAWAGRLPA
ncbi:MAG: hypothetical protein WCP77_11765, partial [Roseococcus sp.]